MAKKARSFSVDEDIDELLRERDDLNASAAVNKFLREYVSSGKGEEAALEVRLEQLDEEISEKRRELERLERERDRVEAQLESRRSELHEQLNRVEEKIAAGEFPVENVDAENPAIQRWAGEAGVQPSRFVDELEARVGGDTDE